MRIRCGRSTRSLVTGPIWFKSPLRSRRTARSKSNNFLKEFEDLTDTVIRPTMEMAVERLRTDGGDGLIEEHHLDALHKPRVTLWMSMQGEVASPRQDLNPFLQLDADVANRRITVWEGDMVKNQGTSRATSPWTPSEVTPESIMDRIVGVLRRAGTHGVGLTGGSG